MATEEPKLSKSQQKKLAKKAEKAAKKADNTAAPSTGPPPTPTEQDSTTSPSAASSSTLSYQIVHAKDDVPTLKVAWASLLANIELSPASATTDALWSQHPTLLLNQQFRVSGGGNAMALALSLHPYVHQLLMDEWLEWERTVLRKSPANLHHLEHALHHSQTQIHLVGTTTTVADVCVLATLSTMTVSDDYPCIQRYQQAHQEGLQAAKERVQQLLKTGPTTTISQLPTIDMDQPSLYKALHEFFSSLFTNLFGEGLSFPANLVSVCSKPKDGDYQCTGAMSTFAHLKKNNSLGNNIQSPQQLAQMVQSALDNHPVIQEIKIIGPGFLTFRVGTTLLEHHVNHIVEKRVMPLPKDIQSQTCLVDFSSPNIAKEMHVGHLRSTIIGESVCRILEFVGYHVYRVNHVGDWGTQFGMLIQYLKEEYPAVGNGSTNELPNITDLTEFYKNAKQRFDDSPEFKKTSQLNVVALQSGDADCLRIWKMLCDVSRREFDKVYKRLDVKTEEFGESFYNDKIAPVIEEFNQAGRLTVEEGGAKCVFLDDKKFKIPLMLQKSDGGYGYDSTDMAALKYRLFELKADRLVYITDYSQGDHFKMVFAAGGDIGWIKEQQVQHIGFGTVNGEDGKRFKTRSGETVRLVDLLDEAVSRMETSLKERIAEGKANITEDEVHEVAEAMGYGAVKYYDLRRNPTSDYKFSYDEMLDTNGDTAIYLLYTRVRLESIIAKAKAEHGVDIEELLKTEKIILDHPAEKNLAFNVNQFSDMIDLTLGDLYPYHVCEYAYKVAKAASDFVTKCYVLGSPEMKSRLLLCHITTIAMKQCFDLLGIRHVKRI